MKNNRKYLLISFAIPWFCLLIWTVFLATTRATGKEVRVSITGYDPRDLLSGRYLAYEIDWDATDCSQFDARRCPKNEFCQEARWGRECRFYVDENKADDLDRLFSWSNRREHNFEVVYAYTPGQTPIAKQLLVDGLDWEEYLAK